MPLPSADPDLHHPKTPAADEVTPEAAGPQRGAGNLAPGVHRSPELRCSGGLQSQEAWHSIRELGCLEFLIKFMGFGTQDAEGY